MGRFVLLFVGLMAALPVAMAAGSGGHIRSESAPPVTLVSVPTPIWSFAQDDDVFAWETGGRWDTRSTIAVRTAHGGRPVTVSQPDGGDGPYVLEVFGLSGQRVVWGGFVDCCNNGYGVFETAAPGSKPKELRELYLDFWAWGEYPTGAAGDGRTLVYSLATIEKLGGNRWAVTDGGVWRVVRSKSLRVPGTPPTAFLAAARGMLALVPADRRRFPGDHFDAEVRAASGARVEIRDAATGALRASFVPKGRVSALGMDAQTVAVIVRSGKEARVEWYSAQSGQPLDASSVPRDVADAVDVSGSTIVLRRGKTILAVDAGTGQVRELARANSTPVGLSIEGARVAWADTSGGRGSIRAVTVG